MAEANHTRKAVEEVYRLAEEKVASIDAYLADKNNEYSAYCKDSETTTAEINEFFLNLGRQLERWKQNFNQIVADAYRKQDKQYLALRDEMLALSSKLHFPHEKRRSNVSHTEANDIIFTIHNTLAKVEDVKQSCDEFINQCCVSLRFVGKLNLDDISRDDVGMVEFLADGACAEILPISVPRVKLGGLFHVNFRLTRSHCPASKKHVTHKVTRDDARTGERLKITSYLFDKKDGEFSLGFPITAIVPHTISIDYMNKPIKNSPYTIVFKAGSSHSGVGDSNNNNAMSLQNSRFPGLSKTDEKESKGEERKMDSNSLENPVTNGNGEKEMNSVAGGGVEKPADEPTVRPLGRRFSRLSLDTKPNDNKENETTTNASQSSNLPFVKQEPVTVRKVPEVPKPEVKQEIVDNEVKHVDNRVKLNDSDFHPKSHSTQKTIDETVRNNKNPVSPKNSLGRQNPRSSTNSKMTSKTSNIKNGKIKATQVHEIRNNFHFPIGCGSGPNNEVFICDTGHGVIHQYDGEYRLLNSFGRQLNMHRPSKCLYNLIDDVLYIKDDREIYAWDLRSNRAVHHFELRPKSNIYGLLFSEENKEIITLEANAAALHYISTTNPKNRRKESYAPILHLNPADRKQSKCRFMDFNSNGDIVCSDLGLSQMYLTTVSGEKLNTFGSYGLSSGQFNEPSGVTSDQSGHVFIADSKHNRIQVFDDLGNYMCPVITDQRNRRPSDILLTRESEQLLVMNYLDHVVKVFRLQ